MFNWVNQVSLYMDWSVLCIQVLGYNNICSVRVKTAGSARVVVGKITGFLWTAQIINPFVFLPKHTCLYWGGYLNVFCREPAVSQGYAETCRTSPPLKTKLPNFSSLELFRQTCSISVFAFLLYKHLETFLSRIMMYYCLASLHSFFFFFFKLDISAHLD